LKPTSNRSAAEAKLEMYPPSPVLARLARTTLASAFQRTMAMRRCSTSRLPGNCGCPASGMVLQYGVLNTGGSFTRRERACSRSLRRRKVARSAPSASISASKASSHSRISVGSRSLGATRQKAPVNPQSQDRGRKI
jgi:hypothetical protein